MKKKLSLLLSFWFITMIIIVGCSSNTASNGEKVENSKEDQLIIYTTIFPLQDFTKKIGGNHVLVESVFPPNADAHTYEPTTKQMVKMAEADLFIYTGIGLEGFAEKAHETLETENVKVIKASEGIELIKSNDEDEDEHADKHEDEHTHLDDLDPHVWLDPVLAVQLAENIKNALVELKPETRKDFEENFEQLKEQLNDLDQQFKDVVQNAERSEIIVSHAAYGYWENRYGIQQISISGLSPTNEPSQKELAEIIEFAQKHNLKYVIFEQNVSNNIANIVQSELGAEALTLHNLESITEEETKNGEDYFSLMKQNLETLKKALGR
ncbi:metal ABC transporter substrate-binding protein [Aeribacillus alveayuensis]|uniref:Zinc transport system substrate-binding protein n=1 Tax=Aeribacillus alveayuensis TaxID=279215 RepID=A0ABT9VJ00_9BACI|nr:zinc transport system substrate-binding protein [Bacillus alveayuensis]